jgi:hypothetical protein
MDNNSLLQIMRDKYKKEEDLLMKKIEDEKNTMYLVFHIFSNSIICTRDTLIEANKKIDECLRKEIQTHILNLELKICNKEIKKADDECKRDFNDILCLKSQLNKPLISSYCIGDCMRYPYVAILIKRNSDYNMNL